MALYPIMYALLDIERAGRGLHLLKEFQTRDELAYQSSSWAFGVKEFDLSSGADAFVKDVAWVNTRPAAEWEEHNLVFSLVCPSTPFRLEASLFTLEIRGEEQLPVLTRGRHRYAFASIRFFSLSGGECMPTGHPAHPMMTALLEATQPVYAWVMTDVLCPGTPLDAECLSEPWLHNIVDESMFLGTELLPYISSNLLSKQAGFAHVERLGEGVWVTLPGSSTLVAEYPDPSVVKAHWAADKAVKKALEQMPTPPWAE